MIIPVVILFKSNGFVFSVADLVHFAGIYFRQNAKEFGGQTANVAKRSAVVKPIPSFGNIVKGLKRRRR